MTRFVGIAEGFYGAPDTIALLTGPPQQYGMAKKEQRGGQDTSRNSRTNSKGRGNGRQEQRSRCHVAKHDR